MSMESSTRRVTAQKRAEQIGIDGYASPSANLWPRKTDRRTGSSPTDALRRGAN